MVATDHGPVAPRRHGRGAPYMMAGKTGTAQKISRKGSQSFDPQNLPYAPAPPGAVRRLCARRESDHRDRGRRSKHGGFGGTAAAPIARKVVDAWLLGKMPEPEPIENPRRPLPTAVPLPAVALANATPAAASAAPATTPAARLGCRAAATAQRRRTQRHRPRSQRDERHPALAVRPAAALPAHARPAAARRAARVDGRSAWPCCTAPATSRRSW